MELEGQVSGLLRYHSSNPLGGAGELPRYAPRNSLFARYRLITPNWDTLAAYRNSAYAAQLPARHAPLPITRRN
jgi:hypothetical protein